MKLKEFMKKSRRYSMITCDVCGHLNDPSNVVCEECGSDLSDSPDWDDTYYD